MYVQVAYQAALREALRLLQEHSDKLQQGKLVKDGVFDSNLHRSLGTRVADLLQRMSAETGRECERAGCWGVLGQGTGARLLNPGSNQPLDKQQIFGKTTYWYYTPGLIVRCFLNP